MATFSRAVDTARDESLDYAELNRTSCFVLTMTLFPNQICFKGTFER